MMSIQSKSTSFEVKSHHAPEVERQFPISILVIEDDPDFLELVGGQMSDIAEVTAARSYDEAIQHLEHEHFNLVVCDWALATRTAPEVFHMVDPLIGDSMFQPRKIPVMFMSGSEKIGPTLDLRSLKHFVAVTFILKSLGPPLIRIMAENILHRFNAEAQDSPCRYLS
jgi:CheY-like chemotaxis protein